MRHAPAFPSGSVHATFPKTLGMGFESGNGKSEKKLSFLFGFWGATQNIERWRQNGSPMELQFHRTRTGEASTCPAT